MPPCAACEPVRPAGLPEPGMRASSMEPRGEKEKAWRLLLMYELVRSLLSGLTLRITRPEERPHARLPAMNSSVQTSPPKRAARGRPKATEALTGPEHTMADI